MIFNRINYVAMAVGAVCIVPLGLPYIYTWQLSVCVHAQSNVAFGLSAWCRRAECVEAFDD